MRDWIVDAAIAEQEAAQRATRDAVRTARDRVAAIAIRWVSPDDHQAFYAALASEFAAMEPAAPPSPDAAEREMG